MGCLSSKAAVVKSPSPLPPKPREPTPPPTPVPAPEPTPVPTPVPSPVPPVEFSSDTVDKIIDDRKDKHPVNKTEPGYPEAAPPETGSEEARPKPFWFEDGSIENSSEEDVDLHEIEQISKDDADTDSLTLRPKSNKLETKTVLPTSYKEIDTHAKKATPSLLGSFNDLIGYLKEPITNNDSNKELLTARALIVWLSQQDIDRKSYGEATLDSPAGLLQCLKEKTMTYATCYTRLCRRANLKCSLVKGWVKAASYQPGDTQAPSSLWTAMNVDGSWQLVQPFWICRALYGHSLGGWVKIEADGTTLAEREKASEGVVKSTFQEYYFMPKPEHFIYECCAEDIPWQLLKPTVSVKSEKEFLNLPYLLPPFFGLGLELKSENKCTLVAENGKCKVEFKAKPSNASKLVLRYELFSKDLKGDSEKFLKEKQMSRMVFNSRSNEYFEFDIRFAKEGEYKLVIYGGPFKSPALRLCEFKLICKTLKNPCVPLPLACDEIGWGPGPVSTAAGLLVPTRVGGYVEVANVNPRKTDIKFHVDSKQAKANEYNARLYGSDGNVVGSDSVDCTIKNNWLSVVVTLPGEGEFGLTIMCTSTRSRNTTSTVCNYLLSTKSAKPIKANVRNAKRKLQAACEVEVTMEQMKHKISDIETAMDKCVREKINENDEDLSAAKTLLIFLMLKDKLRDAILRRNHGVAMKTLSVVSRYSYKEALRKQINAVNGMIETLE